jgi:DnaJ-class molecular chaperone
MSRKQPPPCPGCSGTGQIHFFGGVSRFQFSYEECPECCGTGILDLPDTNSMSLAESSAVSEQFLAILSETLTKALTDGETVRLRGFGSFSCRTNTAGKRSIRFLPAGSLLS